MSELPEPFETKHRQVWNSLELPPPRPAPPDFAQRILRRYRKAEDVWPAWLRLASAAALVLGVATGLWIEGRGRASVILRAPATTTASADASSWPDSPVWPVAAPSLSERYWANTPRVGDEPLP